MFQIIQSHDGREAHRQHMGDHGGVIVNIIADMFRGFPMMSHTGTLHSWPQCPEGDIRPVAILSRAFGSSGTARHRQVNLYE